MTNLPRSPSGGCRADESLKVMAAAGRGTTKAAPLPVKPRPWLVCFSSPAVMDPCPPLEGLPTGAMGPFLGFFGYGEQSPGYWVHGILENALQQCKFPLPFLLCFSAGQSPPKNRDSKKPRKTGENAPGLLIDNQKPCRKRHSKQGLMSLCNVKCNIRGEKFFPLGKSETKKNEEAGSAKNGVWGDAKNGSRGGPCWRGSPGGDHLHRPPAAGGCW